MTANRLDRKGKSAREQSTISSGFVSHLPTLKRFLARFFSRPQDIEDVAQETYLRAFDAERAGEEVRSPKAFLFRIAKNLALNELARKSRLLTDYIEDLASPDVLGEESESAEDQ